MNSKFKYYWGAIIFCQLIVIVLFFVLNDRSMPLRDTVNSLIENRNAICLEHQIITSVDKKSYICGEMDLGLNYVNHFLELRNSLTEKTIYLLTLITVFSNLLIIKILKKIPNSNGARHN